VHNRVQDHVYPGAPSLQVLLYVKRRYQHFSGEQCVMSPQLVLPLPFEDPKEGQIEQLEDSRDVR
jgi:hypothetical protein